MRPTRRIRFRLITLWLWTSLASTLTHHGDLSAAPEESPSSALFRSVSEVRALMATHPVVFVDARETADYYLGHIPGAIHLPWRALTQRGCGLLCGSLDPDPDYLTSVITQRGLRLQTNTTIVIYGGGAKGWGEEGRTFWTLEYLGLKDVVILDGGFPWWQKQGGAVARLWRGTDPVGEPIHPSPQPDLLANRAQVRRWLNDDTVSFIDARSIEEYAGVPKYGEARPGHIPHARHLHWRSLLQRDGRLKSKEALRSLMKKRGISPDRRLVVYCTGGVRSGFVYAVLRHLGYTRITNFSGSMWDYAADPTLPLSLGTPSP